MGLELLYNEDGAKVHGGRKFEGNLGEEVGEIFEDEALEYVRKLLRGELLVDFAQENDAAVGVIKEILAVREGVLRCFREKSADLAKAGLVDVIVKKVLNDVLATIEPLSEKGNFWGFSGGEIEGLKAYWFVMEALKKLLKGGGVRVTLDGDESDEKKVFNKVWRIVKVLNSVRLGNLLAPIVEDLCGERSGVKVLDLGAGDGLVTEVVKQRLIKKRVDLSFEVQAFDIEVNTERDEELGEIVRGLRLLPNIPSLPSVVKMDVLGENFQNMESDSADVIVVSNLLHKLPRNKHKEFMANVYRILKPGGAVVVNSPWYQEEGSELPEGMKAFYEAYDTTMYKDAILSEEALKSLMLESGFRIRGNGVHKLGFQGGTLDGFAHIAFVGVKEKS